MPSNGFSVQISKLVSDNPTKYIKIRDVFDEVFSSREIGSAREISDYEYKRISGRFSDIDVPFSWCSSKEAVYELYQAVDVQRRRARRNEQQAQKQVKSKKKGLFGFFK